MNTRRFSLLAIAASLILASLACGLPAGTGSAAPIGPCASPFLPTKVGTTWRYDISGDLSDTLTRSVLTADASGFTDQDLYRDSHVLRTGKWKCDHGNLTRLDMNSGPTAFVAAPLASMPAVDAQTTDSSGMTLPAVIHAGDTWTQTTSLDSATIVRGKNVDTTSDVSMTCTAAGPESVVVPAGTFNAMRMDCHIDQTITVTIDDLPPVPAPLSYQTTDWYAPNVGWVKSITTNAGKETDTILVSFTIP